MTPEGRVKERVKKLLKDNGAYYHMPVQNGMGAPTLDFVGCINGKFFAIETKAGTARMTPRQALTAKAMSDAGAAVFEVNERESSIHTLRTWLVVHSVAQRIEGGKVNGQIFTSEAEVPERI